MYIYIYIHIHIHIYIYIERERETYTYTIVSRMLRASRARCTAADRRARSRERGGACAAFQRGTLWVVRDGEGGGVNIFSNKSKGDYTSMSSTI